MNLDKFSVLNNAPIILYHRDCSDGFGAACVAEHYFRQSVIKLETPKKSKIFEKSTQNMDRLRKIKPIYFSVEPNRIIDDLQQIMGFNPESMVLSVDIGFTREAYDLLNNRFKNLIIIDHHISTYQNLVNINIVDLIGKEYLPTNIIFDLNKSACVLAWEYFFPNKNIPIFLLYLQDRDLYRFMEPESREINLALFHHYPPSYIEDDRNRPDFSQWLKIMLDTKSSWLQKIQSDGVILRSVQVSTINRLKRSAHKVTFADHQVMICNSSVEMSDLGNVLAEENECDYAIVFRISGSDVFLSLRSFNLIPDLAFNVSDIARKYGGGGHQSAASFKWSIDGFKLNRKILILK